MRVGVVVAVPAHIGERGMVVVDAGVDDSRDDPFALGGGAARFTIPDRRCADPGGAVIGQELKLDIRDDRGHAGKPGDRAGLGGAHLKRDPVEDRLVREDRRDRSAKRSLDGCLQCRVLSRQVREVRSAGRAVRVEARGTDHGRIRCSQAIDSTLVSGQRRRGRQDRIATRRRLGHGRDRARGDHRDCRQKKGSQEERDDQGGRAAPRRRMGDHRLHLCSNRHESTEPDAGDGPRERAVLRGAQRGTDPCVGPAAKPANLVPDWVDVRRRLGSAVPAWPHVSHRSESTSPRVHDRTTSRVSVEHLT